MVFMLYPLRASEGILTKPAPSCPWLGRTISWLRATQTRTLHLKKKFLSFWCCLYVVYNRRTVLRKSNQITRNTFSLIGECLAKQIPFSIENPDSSYLWKTVQYRQLCKKVHMQEVVLDYCQYGMKFRKRTKIAYWSILKIDFLSDRRWHTLHWIISTWPLIPFTNK